MANSAECVQGGSAYHFTESPYANARRRLLSEETFG
jgi:hypothetical protein